MTTKQLGNIGEAKALAKLVSMNVPVPTIWLCNVTKHVCDGDFPSDLYIYK